MSTPIPPDPQAAAPAPTSVTRVKIVENGPLQIKGEFELLDHDGNPYDLKGRRSVLLCRCGGSTTKPFCDGTHSHTGFAAAERAVADEQARTDAPPAETPAGPRPES